MPETLPTKFAPAERASNKEIFDEATSFQKEADFSVFINSIPDMTLVLNHERQIVYANNLLLDFLNVGSIFDIAGARPGEAFRCMHSEDEEGGCGTSEFCRVCGAVNGIIKSQQLNGMVVKECRLTTMNGDALDLQVYATAYEFKNNTYTLFTIRDISDQKRRRFLERIFFHDVLNTAGGVVSYAELLNHVNDAHKERLSKTLSAVAYQLVEELKAQQMVLAAENNDLGVHPGDVDTIELIAELKENYCEYYVARGKYIRVSEEFDRVTIHTDRILLLRVLGNMLKNACEASAEGDVVTLDCKKFEDGVRLSVHNQGYIPKDVQLQLFNRSFSTKGECRGLGTYSIRLITRRYLNGTEGFTSTEEDGTEFFVYIPFVLEV
jgi:signal transduction histidine kinase